MNWQPIETAPKDRPILVYGNKEKGDQAEFSQRIAVAVYHSEMHYTYGDRPMFVYAPHRVEGMGQIVVFALPIGWICRRNRND